MRFSGEATGGNVMLPIIIKAGKILGDKGVPNFTALAQAIGCNRSSLYTWRRVPTHYIKKIVGATGGRLTRSQIRPDLPPVKIPGQADAGKRGNVRKRKRGAKVRTTDVIVGRWGHI